MAINYVELNEKKHSWADDYCPLADYEMEDINKLNLDNAWRRCNLDGQRWKMELGGYGSLFMLWPYRAY
jgi:hypothetical protein